MSNPRDTSEAPDPFGLIQKSNLNPTARSDQWDSCFAPKALEQKGITLNTKQKGGDIEWLSR